MIYLRKVMLATIASGWLSLSGATNAGEIYNNLPDISSTAGSSAISAAGASYNSFFTGASDSLLTDVKLVLSGIPTNSATFTVSLNRDSSTSPGDSLTTLGTFKDSALAEPGTTGAGSVFDVFLTTPFALTADTRYWVELSGPSSSVNWDYATDATGVGVSGEYNAYGLTDPPSVFSNGPGTGPFQMEVTTSSASAVPEPGTLCQALSALGVGLLAIAHRRMVRS